MREGSCLKCNQSVGTILISVSNCLINFDPAIKDERLNVAGCEAGFTRVLACVCSAETDSWKTRSNSNRIASASDRASWNDRNLGSYGADLFDEAVYLVGSIELEQVE